VFEPLILGAIALYLLLGWIFLWLVARDYLAERRGAAKSFVLAVLIWPVTVIAALASRGRRDPRP
jgi:hypothetical protein